MIHLCFSTIDQSVGRFDPSMLSDQDIMEIVVSDLIIPRSSKNVFYYANGNFREVTNWDRLTCNARAEVREIEWETQPWLSGSVSLDILPPKLTILTMANSFAPEFHVGIDGTLNTWLLPRCLEVIDITKNQFHGTIDLRNIPPAMLTFAVACNYFEGAVDLKRLPEGLYGLFLTQNKFAGTISLDALPKTLIYLYLEDNRLGGSVSFASLPKSLETMYLDDNAFKFDANEEIPVEITFIRQRA